MRHSILIVDDNVQRLLTLSALLESDGYDVLTCADSRQAERILSLATVDLVVLDYFMPVMSGGELALGLRRNFPHIPIVLYSSALSLPELVMSMVDGCISAEGEPEALRARVREILDARQAKAS